MIKVTTYSFFNGRGQSRVVLGISVITLAINAILAYSWILGRFGFPAWGVAGAGWATFVASFVSAVLGFSLMMRKKYRDECGMAQIWKFDLTLFRRLMRFGFPNGLYVAIETAAFAAFIIFIGRMGEAELAASTMAFALNTICFLPTLGIGQAIEVLVGRHLGENRADLAENRTWIGFAMGSAVMITFAVLFVAAPDIALAPFVTEKNSMELSMTRTLLRFIAFYSLFDAANAILAFALRGAGDTRFVTKVMSFVPWLGMVLPTWLSLKYDWGLFWAWGFATFYVCLLAFIFLARFLHGAWRSMRVIEPELIA